MGMIPITKSKYLFSDACCVKSPEPKGLGLIAAIEILRVAPIVTPFWLQNPCKSIGALHAIESSTAPSTSPRLNAKSSTH